jgi:hypothetical protein
MTMEKQTFDYQYSLRLLQEELDKERLKTEHWKQEAELKDEVILQLKCLHQAKIDKLTESYERYFKELSRFYRDGRSTPDERVEQIGCSGKETKNGSETSVMGDDHKDIDVHHECWDQHEGHFGL